MRIAFAITTVLTIGGLAAAPAVVSPTSVTADDGLAFVEVTFDHDITQVDRDALTAAGAVAVTPTGARTYRAALPLGATVRGAEVATVAATDKIDAALDRTTATPVAVRTTTSSADAVAAELRRLGGDVLDTVPVRESAGLVEVVVTLDGAAAAGMAASPAVAYVGPAPVAITAEDEKSAAVLARLVASGSDAGLGPDPSWEPRYEEWLADLGIDGTGVNVAVVDTGVDEEHPNLRVVGTVDYASPHDEPVDVGGHGTHVAGIIAGTGEGVPDEVASDADGFEVGTGVAPGAGITNQNIIGTSVASSHISLFEQAVADAMGLGANIWNASWTSGEGTNVGYTASGARLDALIRDGDPQTGGAQPFVMAFSAGNSGSGTDGEGRLTAPKEAKNLIVVASLDSPTDNPALGYSNDPRNISSFSSRGPTVDGRIGITVAAPGGDVRSTRSFIGSSCSTPVVDVAPGLYSYCSGTSMAAPHAAGSAALVTQWWREGQGAGADPSAALVRALLVNSAVDLMFPDIPNINEGWGRIDLDALFRPGTGRLVRDGQDVLTDPGEVHSLPVTVDGTSPLKVTVAWDDVPGDPAAAAAIVNDLDLELVAPDGTVYRGNNFDRGWSVAGGDADRLEVLENVYVEDPAVGSWTIRVAAAALPGDGALEQGDATDQDYTLVVSGIVD